jgi:hypothetical protein
MAIDTIKSTAVLDGAIATADIADDAVTADKLANAINTSIAAKAPTASPTFTGTTTANLLASNGTILGLQTNGTAVGGIGTLGGATYFGSQQSGIMFNGVNQNPTNGTSTRVDNTNDLGAQSYRYKDIYLGGGAFLGGTSTPNKLDDYEEGTWTPTLSASGYTFQYNGATAGRYVKIGCLVHINGYIRLSHVPSGSGTPALNIAGLPFVASNVDNSSYTAGAMIVEGSGSIFSGIPTARLNKGSTTFYIMQNRPGQSPLFGSVNVAGLTSAFEFEFQFSYQTTA